MGYVYTPQTTDLLSGCACAIIFILLLSLDVWRANKRKAYWYPAGFLALNALTLQFIYYVDYSTVNVTTGTEGITDKDVGNFLRIQLVIDSGRLVICVFIAYLLPGLACFRNVGGDIGALALNVLFHMFHEIYLIDDIYAHFSAYEETWFTVFSVMVSIAIILLVLLSICVVLACKSIHIIIREKVCSVLWSSRTGCENIGGYVLKCWIVVRCSQPEYIMARSVVSSFAGLLVTVCVILMAVKWSCIYKDDYKKLKPLNKTTLCLQFIFALFGWIVVSVRWLTAVRYYFPRHGHNLFHVEDFWKRSLTELKNGQLKGRLCPERRNRNRTPLESVIVNLIIAVHLDKLVLFIGLYLQILIVLLSKAFFFLSRILFGPLLMDCEKIRSLSGSQSEFSEYRGVLESIAITGEMPESLWIANESAFKLTKEHMKRGENRSQDLIAILGKLQEEATVADKGEEEKYLDYAGKRSWKLKAVSLIHLMLCSYDDTKYVDYAFQACSEAWPVMDFVETSNREANLACFAADKEFDDLQNTWNKVLKKKSTQSEPLRTEQKRIIEDIKSRISKVESQGSVENMQDPMEAMMTAAANFSLMTAAANFSLNETLKSLSQTSKSFSLYSAHAINKLRCLLADVIIDCLKNGVENALREKCFEWAVCGEETEIYHAAFMAGYAQTSQGNNESEGDVNNASRGEAADFIHEKGQLCDLINMQTSQGNDKVPPELPEGHVSNTSGGAAVAEAADLKGPEIEDGGGSVGDDNC